MIDNKGGRGVKAKFPTKTMRIPEILEQELIKLIKKLYEDTNEINAPQKLVSHTAKTKVDVPVRNIITDKQELIDIAKKILASKRSAKLSLEKLLQVITNDNNIKL